jgi:hypothetical protein
MKLRAVVGVAFMLVAGQAFAVEAAECIRVVDRSSLQNACNRKINLTYCVDHPKSEFNCRRGRGFGAKTLSPGNKEFIPFYSDNPGRIWWAACFDPQGPRDWKGPGDQYICK